MNDVMSRKNRFSDMLFLSLSIPERIEVRMDDPDVPVAGRMALAYRFWMNI